MKNLKRLRLALIVFLSICFSISLYSGEKYESQPKTVNIFILNTGDIHQSSQNLNKISSFISSERQSHPGRVIVVDIGDMLTQYPFPDYVSPSSVKNRDWAGQNEKMYKWASSVNYDAMLFGNHDFIGGVKLLQKFPDLPFVCANLEYPKHESHTNYLGEGGIIPPYKIIKLKDGISVAIIGIADQNIKDYHFPKDSAGHSPEKDKLTVLCVNDSYVKKVIEEIKKISPDFIVILSHNDDSIDEKYVSALPVNKPVIIIGGHSHQVIPEVKKLNLPQNCYLVKSGKEGEDVGSTMVTLDLSMRKVVDVSVKNIRIK